MRGKEHEHVEAGRRADEVLQNPAFREALEALRSDVVATWKACPVRDTEGQKLLLQLVKLTDKFEGLLVSRIQRGKDAQARIDLDSARDEPAARRFFRKVVG